MFVGVFYQYSACQRVVLRLPWVTAAGEGQGNWTAIKCIECRVRQRVIIVRNVFNSVLRTRNSNKLTQPTILSSLSVIFLC